MTKTKEMRVLSINPIVALVDDFASEEESKHIIETYSSHLEPAVVSTADGTEERSEMCTSFNCKITPWDDKVISGIVTRMTEFTRYPPENVERATFMRYTGGQEFQPHNDAFPKTTLTGLEQLAKGGQRIFSSLLYLNDVEEGGKTAFPKLGIQVSPKRGRLLIFSNIIHGTIDAHPHAEHAGMPMTDGEKYAIFFGWRQSLFHIPREYPATTEYNTVL